jgi:hypothetical protein
MIPCLICQARTIGILVHNSVFIVHFFQILVHFRGSFPRLKVTFYHGTLLQFETFDARNKKDAYFDGDKITITEATATSLCLLKRAHSCLESYTILLTWLHGVQKNQTHCSPATMCVVTDHGRRCSFFTQGSLEGWTNWETGKCMWVI